VPATEALAQHCLAKYPRIGPKVFVACNGADVADPSVSPMPIARPDRLDVGYTGHLYIGKGMEVIDELVRTCAFAHFHIVGGKENDITRWKRELGDHENVTFYGHVERAKVPAFVASFDVVLVPNQRFMLGNTGKNIGDFTSPIKLFEYMAAGKPIVASDLPVLREIVANGRNALLCDPERPDAWRDALLALHRDEGLRQRIGNAAREDFSANYTWGHRAERILRAVEERSGVLPGPVRDVDRRSGRGRRQARLRETAN
jgi:glycosyltransferase involved in cell wall biosynthesis